MMWRGVRFWSTIRNGCSNSETIKQGGGGDMRRNNSRLLCLAVLAMAAAQPSIAQRTVGAAKDYPAKVIRIVVPYAAGGGPDVVIRTIADKIGPNLGQNIVLENRGGGGGMLGTAIVAKSAPDGYTLLLQLTGAYASYPYFFKNLSYDPAKDLIPVCLLYTS